MTDFKRREFLNALLGAGAAASVGGVTTVFPRLAHAATPAFDDYKALVVLFLHGGNDAHNMIVPLGDESNGTPVGRGYQTYAASRRDIAINKRLLDYSQTNAYAANSVPEAYRQGVYPVEGLDIGINGVMPELAQLMAEKKAAVVANIGTLVEPMTKASFKDRSARRPPFLFAHNHQQRAQETGWADNLDAGGWAGRLADLWQAHTAGGVNGDTTLGLNVSYGGATRLMTGRYNSPTVLSPGSDKLFPRGTGFDSALFRSLNDASTENHPLRRVLKAANYRAAELSDILADQLSKTPDFSRAQGYPEASYQRDLFQAPDAAKLELGSGIRGRTLEAFHSAARMIHLGRNDLGLKRQVLFIGMGGFDNHTELARNHPVLLRELSLALGDFQFVMDHLGIGEEVTVCTLSDFGRSLGNNGDGTDHAWAGHNLVVGGGVNGGSMVGAIPDLTLGGSADTGNKGRLIPDIAVDQYLATLLNWFGVDDSDMPELFPNLANFKANAADPISSAYLAGLMRDGNSEPEDPGDPQDPGDGGDGGNGGLDDLLDILL